MQVITSEGEEKSGRKVPYAVRIVALYWRAGGVKSEEYSTHICQFVN